MNYASKQFVRLGVLAVCAAALTGCQSLRDAAGLGKQSPDEFAVTTKAPLVIPPDFNLRPPRAGAPPDQPDRSRPMPRKSALFDTDPATVAAAHAGQLQRRREACCSPMPAPATPILRSASRSPPTAGRWKPADDSFTDQVLFWQDSSQDTGKNVDADAEAKRIEAQKATGQGAATKPAAQKPTDSATIGKDDKQDSKGGWLDGDFLEPRSQSRSLLCPQPPRAVRRQRAPTLSSSRCRTACRCW